MQRRSFLTTTAALAVGSMIAGTAMADGPISWWYESATPEQQAVIAEDIVAPFVAAHPDDPVTVDYRGDELDNQIRMALLSGTAPDLVYTAGPSYVAPMAQAGQLLALDDYAAQYGWNERILPVFLEMGRYDGHLYALPKTYETLGLFYNATLFAEHGWQVPTTIDELEALADEMLAAGIVPFASGNAGWRGNNEHYVSLAINSIAGPENVYRALTGEIPWTAEPFVEAINRLNDWWQKGYFGPNYFSITTEQMVAELAAGNAGMMPSGTWQFENFEAYFPPANAEVGFAGFPSTEAVGEPVFPLGVGSTLSIAATSGNPDGTAALIDSIFTTDAYARLNTAWPGEWNMPLDDLSGVTLGDEVMPLYTETMQLLAQSVSEDEYGYTTWTFLPPATDSFMISGIEEVWLGRTTVEQYLQEWDDSFRAEAADGKVPAIPAR